MFTSASVFVRTPQGRISAFDTASTLPQALKVLLRGLDGKTPLHKKLEGLRTLSQLQTSLPSYEMLALPAGRAGQEHMARLRAFIQTFS